MDDALALEGPHWAFSLAVYRQPGVAEACLALQDRLGVDVNVLLLTLFATRQVGAPPSGATIAQADAFVRAWRAQVVAPLRGVRRRLKEGPPPAPGSAAEALRQRVKAVELYAEQIEQAALAAWFQERPAEAFSGPGDCSEALRRVAAFYGSAGDDAACSIPNVDLIARAAARQPVGPQRA
jgi:uncharacterized protein (TIGR02444 family)